MDGEISKKPSFNGVTNSDGRVTSWTKHDGTGSHHTLQEAIDTAKQASPKGEPLSWRIIFRTEEYFGTGNTFYPCVEIPFYTNIDEQHYHVPLLLGPWSYTTYRGS